MIEVMVTIVVMAFGLLALACLVLRGLQAGADSQFRTIAVKQTYDMAERMRGNPVGAKSGNTLTKSPPGYAEILPSGSSSTCSDLISKVKNPVPDIPIVVAASTVPACSGTGATFDSNCWQRANMQNLPKGAGAVCKDTTADSNWYAIIVSWDDNRSGSANKSLWITLEP